MVTSISGMTHDILSVHLELADREAFRFAAGQYLTLTIPDAPPRNYSMASRPDEKHIELHIRAVPGGSTSSRIHASLNPGDRIRVEGPAGSAYLREAHTGPIIAVAGGSGLAPIKSIVETALRIGMRQPIHVYFGARAEQDLYLVDHFRALERRFPNFAFVPVLSRDAANQRFRGGYVSDALAEDHGDLTGAKAYVAGPPAMVDAAGASLVARGLSASDIHADVFFTPEQSDNRVA
jgi:CDP-4-dehydro-6-deoxyglucose reductase/ferredoxin-NAD(P)+ reductase (naphthalene dioxygenase ferredoxin-specific)